MHHDTVRHRVAGFFGLLMAMLAVVLINVDWDGPGALAFVAVTGIFSVVIMAAPLRSGVRPRRLAVLPSMAGLCLLLSLASEIASVAMDLRVGPLGYADVTLFAAYAFLGAWLVALQRHLAPERNLTVVLDAAAATIGVVLALWTVAVGALAGGSALASALVLAVYPTVDVLLVSLLLSINLRIGRVPLALRWVTGALIALMVVDFVNVTLALRSTNGLSVAAFSLQMFVFYGLAVGASHPSFAELPHIGRRTGARGERARMVLLPLTLAPAVLAVALPASSAVEATVRGILVAALLIIFVFRLWRTLTEMSEALAEQQHHANHDPLTGLLNRAALMRLLDSRLRHNSRAGLPTAVLFLDVDEFKHVNDTWGHHAGDSLLRHIGTHLPGELRADDHVGRLGGDEFVIVATVRDEKEAVALAERVLQFFTTPALIGDKRAHKIGTSIGIAMVGPGRDDTPDEVLTRADAALYAAKRAGRDQWALADAR